MDAKHGDEEFALNEDYSRFRDPITNGPLTLHGGSLQSADGHTYPIVNGIPRFVPSENYAADFGAQWNRFPKTQLDSHSGITLTEDRLARCMRGELANLSGKRVLEAGCGAGRFTEVLLKHGAIVDAFDFSSAVEANAANHRQVGLTLAQADIEKIPFPHQNYDYVICLGVLQHTPNTEYSIARLWMMVAPGGCLVIDHYAWNKWLTLPPPLGDAEKLYRSVILRMDPKKRYRSVKALVDFWFPIYWATRNSRWARRILSRTAGIHFYYPTIPLKSREQHYEWSLLDTHDGMTDAFKRYRTPKAIERTLRDIGAKDIHVVSDGNGVEGWGRKADAN